MRGYGISRPPSRGAYQVGARILHHRRALACYRTNFDKSPNLSISYIDNREFPGVEDLMPPGPIGQKLLISP